MSYSIDSFWVFSTSFYAEPGVGAACLTLQDEHGYDVVMILGACYAAATGAAPLSDETMAKLVAASAPWRMEVVGMLRQIRRDMKTLHDPIGIPASSQIREEVKRVELAAERALIEALDSALRGPGTASDIAGCAHQNLKTYARAVAQPFLPAAEPYIDALIAALTP